MSIEIFASKFPNVIIVMESYTFNNHTSTCKLHVSFLTVSAFLSKVCDVADLEMLLSFGFGN